MAASTTFGYALGAARHRALVGLLRSLGPHSGLMVQGGVAERCQALTFLLAIGTVDLIL